MAFNTTSGQTIAREKLIAYINTGTSASPTWLVLGTRVEDSDVEYDWGDETIKDILGNTYTTLTKPTVTQTFDPAPLDAGEDALVYIWELSVKEQDAEALAAQDMLIVHLYGDTTNFAERYSSSAVRITSLGGEGGGHIDSTIDVTYGGTRTVGTVTVSGSTVTFTAAA